LIHSDPSVVFCSQKHLVNLDEKRETELYLLHFIDQLALAKAMCDPLQRIRRVEAHLALSSPNARGEGDRLKIEVCRTSSLQTQTEVKMVRNGETMISIEAKEPERWDLVPNGFMAQFMDEKSGDYSQSFLEALLFLMKKDAMGQDIFLVGSPGRTKRNIVLAFCELTQKEVEFVPISIDTTVSDLSQRREIRRGSAIFVDGPAVRAAIKGRVLVLEGVEKAERNILSVLNNLLENREMQLLDGRFLTHPGRYDGLVESEENRQRMWKEVGDGDISLVRVSDSFRVIALGLPVPEYDGNPLDPPFRSRFQALHVPVHAFQRETSEPLRRLAGVRGSLAAAEYAGLEGLPPRMMRRAEFPQELFVVQQLIQQFPNLPLRFLVGIVYPFPSLPWFDPLQAQVVLDVFVRHGIISIESIGAGSLLSRWVPITKDPETGMRRNFRQVREESLRRDKVGMDLEDVAKRSRWIGEEYSSSCGYKLDLDSLTLQSRSEPHVKAKVQTKLSNKPTLEPTFIAVEYHMEIIAQMLMIHTAGLDFCLIGKRGSGKSALVRQFASLVDLRLLYFPLYKDMTSVDFLQRRSTRANGDTYWLPSPLVLAAMSGGVVVLDGLEQVPSATLASLQSLVSDRYMSLPDSGRFLHSEVYAYLQSKEYIVKKQINEQEDPVLAFPVHPDFRIVGVARPHSLASNAGTQSSWLTPEVNTAFLPFIWVRALKKDEEASVIGTLVKRELGEAPAIEQMLNLAHTLRVRNDDEAKSIASTLTTRQMLRIARRLVERSTDENVSTLVRNACLWRFLPSLAQEVLHSEMVKLKMEIPTEVALDQDEWEDPEQPKLAINARMFEAPRLPPTSSRRNGLILRKERPIIGKLAIGDVKVPIHEPSNPLLVPQTLFYDNPRQTKILQDMLVDFELGEHLLLIGNQGVGKNKLADRFLQLLRLPREYIQLDRDTTVNQLTSQPVVEDGVVRYEDSSLVKAAANGHVLVIDEADKAPTHVTAILKSLLADGEMLLADGRRLVNNESAGREEQIIVVHPDFRAIVLANRPGFPFLGNDFFREIGDIFSCYVVDNPDEESEMYLLRKYAPDVPEDTLRKLSIAFQELRGLVDKGTISYPYSTRELVNVVRHMQQYPDDGMATILQNVFDFDQYAAEEKEIIMNLFQKHGIPIGLDSTYKVKLGDVTPLPASILTERWTRSDSSSAFRCAHQNMDIPRKINSLAEPGQEVVFPLANAVKRRVKLGRFEGRTANFTEQVFSFSLPIGVQMNGPTSGVADLALTSEGRLVMAANDSYHSMQLYLISRNFRSFDVFDLHFPHFNFKGEVIPNVRKPAPSRCTLAGLQDGRVAMYVHDEQILHIADVVELTQTLIMLPIDMFRAGQFPHRPGETPGLWTERQRITVVTSLSLSHGLLIFFQVGSSVLAILNTNEGFVTEVRLPVRVSDLEVLSPTQFLVTEAIVRDEFALERSQQSASMLLPLSRFHVLHAEGERMDGEGAGLRFGEEDDDVMLSVDDVVDEEGERVYNTPPSAHISAEEARRASLPKPTIVYDNFVIEAVERIHVAGPGAQTRLHCEHSFISADAMTSNQLPMRQGESTERRAMYSKGTLAQLLGGFESTFDFNNAAHSAGEGSKMSGQQEAQVRSYLRTTSSSVIKASEEAFAGSTYVSESSQLCNMFLRDASATQDHRNRSGYLGFAKEGYLEVIDMDNQNLRQIRVELPDTSIFGAQRSLMAASSRFVEEEGLEGDEPESFEYSLASAGVPDGENLARTHLRRLIFMLPLPDGNVLVADRTGTGRVFEVDAHKLQQSYENWEKLVGSNSAEMENLDVDFDEDDNDDWDEEGSDEFDDSDEEDEDADLQEIEFEGELEIQDGEFQGEGEMVIIKGAKIKGPRGKRRRGRGAGGRARPGGKGRLNGSRRGRARAQRGRGRGRARGRKRETGDQEQGEGQGQGQGKGEGQGEGEGEGTGSGYGNGGGSGSGGSGGGRGGGGRGGSMSLPEPGQSRPRKLSDRARKEVRLRISELKEMLKLFPYDSRLESELERLEDRLGEADDADAMEDLDDELTHRLARERRRLEHVERQLAMTSSDVRLQAEAEQLKKLIERLEQQLQQKQRDQRTPDRTRRSRNRKDEEMAKEAKKEAARIGNESWKSVLKELDMQKYDGEIYLRYKEAVKQEIHELRSTLQAMERRKNERTWIKNRDNGDLDDTRIVDALTGSRNIYKRRMEKPPDPYSFMSVPKQVCFLMDCSSSMAHMSFDGRLERSLEAVCMVLESLKGFEWKFKYSIRGHSGTTDDLVFVNPNKIPSNEANRLRVLREINAHAETCSSGDNTLEATRLAIKELASEEADESFLVIFSDANLTQYGIEPSDLLQLINQDARVNVFIIFIGSSGDEAQMLKSELPPDRAFITLQTNEIPRVLKRIFMSSLLN